MISVLFVGDGERDGVTVPRFVERILGQSVDAISERWARLHGSGFERKLAFAVRQAESLARHGLVATVDADQTQDEGRLKRLRDQRDAERARTLLPIAIAEAVPHGEAWLLDDPVAVREGLGLDRSVQIPSVRKAKSPKVELTALFERRSTANARPLEAWEEIAKRVDPKRCAHASETGFQGLVDEVYAELGPLVRPIP